MLRQALQSLWPLAHRVIVESFAELSCRATVEFWPCETRMSAPRAWLIFRSSSPSSARTYRTREGSPGGSRSAGLACRSSTIRRASTAPLSRAGLLPFRFRRPRSRHTTMRSWRTAFSTPIGQERSTSPTTEHCGRRTTYKSRSSTSSGRGLAGTSPSSRATCARTIRRGGWCSSPRRAARAGRRACARADRGSARAPLRRSRERASGSIRRRFRGRVVPAYSSQCAICRLKELRLLDAAHIVATSRSRGAHVSNGLSLCSIHHRAFDQNLVGVSPDYLVHVSRRLREDEDGPMLDLLKAFHEAPLNLPEPRARSTGP